jgi:hypothetical protein
VAASIARRHVSLQGAATGVLSIVMYWVDDDLMNSATSPVWYLMITTVLTIPCAMLGRLPAWPKVFAENDTAYGGSTLPIP